MYDIAFFEAFKEEANEIRRHLPPEFRAYYTEKTIQDEQLPDLIAPVISLRTQSQIPIEWAPKLTAIITRSTGYDHVLKYHRDSGIPVPACHLPYYCNRAVAEHALLLWAALLRKLPQQLDAFKSFSRNHLTGGEIKGRTLAVFGVGMIGREVVDVGRGLGMKVLGVDLENTMPDLDFVEKDEALAQADVIVCAMNLTTQNDGYFDDAAWKQVKPGTVFVNISRGELSPFVPLLQALESGQLSGIGLDVYNEEKNIAGFLRGTGHEETEEWNAFLKLRDDPRVLFTPHNAFNSHEAVIRKSIQSIEQYLHFQKTGKFTTPVPAEH